MGLRGSPAMCRTSLPCRGRQRNSVDGVGAVTGDVGEPGVLVEAEVVCVVDRRDELDRARGFEGGGVNFDAHEDFLRGAGVVKIAGVGSIAHPVDAWLWRRRDLAVGVVGHRVVGQPDPGAGVVCPGSEVDAPDQAREAVGDQDHSRAQSAAAVEPASAGVKGEDDLRGDWLAWVQPLRSTRARWDS